MSVVDDIGGQICGPNLVNNSSHLVSKEGLRVSSVGLLFMNLLLRDSIPSSNAAKKRLLQGSEFFLYIPFSHLNPSDFSISTTLPGRGLRLGGIFSVRAGGRRKIERREEETSSYL